MMMFSHRFLLHALLLALSLSLLAGHKISSSKPKATPRPLSRGIRIRNTTPTLTAVFWISVSTQEYVPQQSDLFPTTSISINSFVSHTFAVVEVTGGCYLPDGITVAGTGHTPATDGRVCREGRFSVSESDNQVVMVTATSGEFTVSLLDDEVRTATSVASGVERCVKATSGAPPAALESCLGEEMAKVVGHWSKLYDAEKVLRLGMSDLIENYTCADALLPTSKPIESSKWRYVRRNDGVAEPPRQSDVLFDNGITSVHVISDFISPAECAAIEAKAEKSLHQATVADDNGGSKMTPNRKAKQAGVKVEWEKEGAGDLIARLSRRVYEYTNAFTNYNLMVEGQEDIMSIQYEGRGIEDKEPDRYMPHCDGECTGDEFREGNRLATMVIYCDVPSIGGATNFAKSNLHIVPKEGSATFFSYVGTKEPIDAWPQFLEGGELVEAINDDKFSEHSGCPVIEGKKKIVTQWMRKGVSKENPWDAFNTMGVKKSEAKMLKEQTKRVKGKDEL